MAEHSAFTVSVVFHPSFCALYPKHTKISERLDLLGYGETALVVDHGTFWLVGLFIVVWLFSQIAHQGDEDELDARAVFGNLGYPLGFDVLERVC
jgi:hypothetical protein